jgi:uncharacterized membrane protein
VLKRMGMNYTLHTNMKMCLDTLSDFSVILQSLSIVASIHIQVCWMQKQHVFQNLRRIRRSFLVSNVK